LTIYREIKNRIFINKFKPSTYKTKSKDWACHGILSKYIYAHPPMGVPIDQAKTGGLVMYYGGDAIGLILITILCYQRVPSSYK